MSTSYAREQLGNAVLALATGVGSIQERLIDAWTRRLIHINEERDLPSHHLTVGSIHPQHEVVVVRAVRGVHDELEAIWERPQM